MKRVFPYAYLIFFLCAKLNAQVPPSYYNETYGISGLQNSLTCVKKFDSSFFALSINSYVGVEAKTAIYKYNNMFIRTDSVVIELNNQSIVSYLGSNMLQDTINNYYFVSGTINQNFSGSTKTDGDLWKLNSNLDTLWHKTYVNTNDSSIIIAGSTLVDTCIILYGQTKEIDTNGDAFIIKTDLNGNEIYRRKYPIANRFGGISKLIHTMDNCFIGIENILDYPTWGYSDIKVTKYDSLLNPVWSQTYGTSYMDYLGDLIELSDGNILFSQGLGISQNNPPWGAIQCRGTLTKINNTNGGIIWQQSYGDTRVDIQMYNVLERNNKLFALGFTATSCASEVKPNCTHISYMLVADQNGDSLHYATIFPDSISAWDYLYDLAPTNDGFFCVGTANLFNGTWDQQNWIVKADTNGCFNSDCAQGIGIPENPLVKSNILLFPNPTSSLLNFNLPIDINSFDNNKKIVIYDGLGKIVLNKVITNQNFSIDVSDLIPGIYFITITNHGIPIIKDKFIKK